MPADDRRSPKRPGNAAPVRGAAPPPGGTRTAFRVIAVLLSLAVVEGAVIIWLFLHASPAPTEATGEGFVMRVNDENIVRKAYPQVDFSRIYPGWKAEDIDLVQRECYSLRYVYEPFVQFRPLAVKKRFVEVTEAGYRAGGAAQPWPPDPADFVVFVFGGSTTFSYGVPNDQTVVAFLQEELSRGHPDRRVQCYNFGSGYYFSTQERALFESLLLRGIVPNAAIFIDGINDYHYDDGRPQLTATLHHFLSPDLPAPTKPAVRSNDDVSKVIDAVLQRYRLNLQMIDAVAQQSGVHVVFVGQPSPFLEFPRNQTTYPFGHPFVGHELCERGYPRFKELAERGAFGPHFIWAGDAFSDAHTSMYADGIHYSPEGARILAHTIAERAGAQGLLP